MSWAVPSKRYRDGDPANTGIAAVMTDWGPLFEVVQDGGRMLHGTFSRGITGPVDDFQADRALRAVAIGADVIWAAGDRGLVVRASTTKAAGYTIVDSPPGDGDWLGVWATTRGDPWLAGTSGGIAHFAGDAWTVEQAGNESLHGIWGLPDESRLWAVGRSGAVLERLAGGPWQPDVAAQALTGQAALNAITGVAVAAAAPMLWAAGEGGLVIHFDGRRWSRIDVNTTQTLTALWVDSLMNEIWAVGHQSTVRVWSTLTDHPAPARTEDPDWRGFNDSTDLLSIGGIHTVKPWGMNDQIEAVGLRGCHIDRWYRSCPIP
jgi:hypothetical protein